MELVRLWAKPDDIFISVFHFYFPFTTAGNQEFVTGFIHPLRKRFYCVRTVQAHV